MKSISHSGKQTKDTPARICFRKRTLASQGKWAQRLIRTMKRTILNQQFEGLHFIMSSTALGQSVLQSLVQQETGFVCFSCLLFYIPCVETRHRIYAACGDYSNQLTGTDKISFLSVFAPFFALSKFADLGFNCSEQNLRTAQLLTTKQQTESLVIPSCDRAAEIGDLVEFLDANSQPSRESIWAQSMISSF
jgi:hypothetical protein